MLFRYVPSRTGLTRAFCNVPSLRPLLLICCCSCSLVDSVRSRLVVRERYVRVSSVLDALPPSHTRTLLVLSLVCIRFVPSLYVPIAHRDLSCIGDFNSRPSVPICTCSVPFSGAVCLIYSPVFMYIPVCAQASYCNRRYKMTLFGDDAR